MRMSTGPNSVPKPMMMIGSRPVLWHVMRYYAHFGHTEFILCLGHGAQAVKDYFLDYRETSSNDFVLRDGGRAVELLETDISAWTITFIHTGMDASIGERLRRVRHLLKDEEIFLANYGDVLTDAPMNDLIANFRAGNAVASLLAVKPPDSFHVVEFSQGTQVSALRAVGDTNMRVNGGYFIMRPSIFDYLNEGDDLVTDACVKAAAGGRMSAVLYDGYWAPMDTLKERAALEEQYRGGVSPWTLWREPSNNGKCPVGPVSVPQTVTNAPHA